MNNGVYLQVAGLTDAGCVRAKNEDAFVVADLTGQALLDGTSTGIFPVGDHGHARGIRHELLHIDGNDRFD